MTEYRVGLIAIWREAKPLLNYVKVDATTTPIQARLYQGHLAGRPVILAALGPGKVQTAAVTQHLIDRYAVNLMISCGSAGALAPHLQIGDVILANQVAMHDAGIYINGGFEHLGIYDNTHPGRSHFHRALAADPPLLAAAQQATRQIAWPNRPARIETGGLVSGDQVVADDRKKQWLRDTFNALALDMETGGMAQVAFLNDVPWLAVRAISDSADSTLKIDLASVVTYSDEPNQLSARLRKTMRQVITVAQQPTLLKTTFKFQQGLRRAAANAASVTAAIIAQLE